MDTSSARNSKACPTKTADQAKHPQGIVSGNTTTLNQATRARLETTSAVLKKTCLGMPAPLSVAAKGDSRRCSKTTAIGTGPPTLKGLLGTCNSGFLSNLLKDVAHAKDEILQAKRQSGATDNTTAASPLKRRRISVLSTSSSSAPSIPSKDDGSTGEAAAAGVGQQINQALNQDTHTRAPPPPVPLMLDLLWEESWLAPAAMGEVLPPAMRRSVAAFCGAPNVPPPHAAAEQALPVVAVIEPDLPATVSEAVMDIDSSSNSTDLQENASSSSSVKDESFGWFVAMDEDGDDEDFCMVHHSSSLANNEAPGLAFSDPRRSSTAAADAEVEWAKAADTVDDVLGDLF